MNAKTFLDTNILVYAMDARDPAKQSRAAAVLQTLGVNAVISTQVLQEFYVAATRKLRVDPLVAQKQVAVLETLTVVVTTPPLINAAIDLSIQHQLSFWDALILVSAASAGCQRLLSEDLQDRGVLQGVQIINPLI